MRKLNLINLCMLREYFGANVEALQPKLRMRYYRTGTFTSHICKTTGCVIGHATGIPEFKKYVTTYPNSKDIHFNDFARDAFGIDPSDLDSSKGYGYNEWSFLFGAYHPDSIVKFLERLDEFIAEAVKEPK